MTAAEVFISLHGVDAARDGVPLRRVMAALDPCMKEDMRSAFPPESMAVALQQLVTRSARLPCRQSPPLADSPKFLLIVTAGACAQSWSSLI